MFVANLLAPLRHEITADATSMERTFLRQMGGGCLAPIGAYAAIAAGRTSMTAFVGSPSGEVWLRRKFECEVADAQKCAIAAANEMLDAGGRDILAQGRAAELQT